MIYRHSIGATSYVFDGLRDLMARATPPRSGDRLAGLAADSAEQMIAARIAYCEASSPERRPQRCTSCGMTSMKVSQETPTVKHLKTYGDARGCHAHAHKRELKQTQPLS